MNCKPGDMAIVIRSLAGNGGKIVRCIRLAGPDEVHRVHGRWPTEDWWVIDRSIPWSRGQIAAMNRDSNLRPITPPAGTISSSEVSELYAPRAPERVKANSAEFISSKERER
jgi:hypothetical protein